MALFKSFLNYGLINEVSYCLNAQGSPHLSTGAVPTGHILLVLAYVISPPWVLLSRALKLCACSVGPGRQKNKEKKVSNWLYCQVQPQILPKLYKEGKIRKEKDKKENSISVLLLCSS